MKYMINILDTEMKLVDQRLVDLPKVTINSQLLLAEYVAISPNFWFNQLSGQYITITKGV